MRWKPRSGRIRYHLRAPIPKSCELLNENTRNTVNEMVPLYWSSSQDSSSNAWFQDFVGGGQFSDRKGDAFWVRPLRVF